MTLYENTRTLLIAVSSVLTLLAVVPYLIEIARGQAKPRLVSWFVWGTLAGIGAAGSFANHQNPAAIFTLACGVECGLIVLLGLRHGDHTLEMMDGVCLFGALAGLIALIGLRNPTYAVLTVIGTDFIGSLPTVKHAWQRPREETWLTYVLYALGGGLLLLVADLHVVTAFAYPAYILVMDTMIALVIVLNPRSRLRSGVSKKQADGVPHATRESHIESAGHPPLVSTSQSDAATLTVTAMLTKIDSHVWTAALSHPWVKGLERGSLAPASIGWWAQQERFLSLWESRALMVLRSYRWSSNVETALSPFAGRAGREPALLGSMLDTLGLGRAGEAWPASLGYGSFLLSCAHDGLVDGLTAMYARYRLHLALYALIGNEMNSDATMYEWVAHHSDESFSLDVHRLGQCLDALSGAPAGGLATHLNSIMRSVVLFEIALWDATMSSQGPARE